MNTEAILKFTAKGKNVRHRLEVSVWPSNSLSGNGEQKHPSTARIHFGSPHKESYKGFSRLAPYPLWQGIQNVLDLMIPAPLLFALRMDLS